MFVCLGTLRGGTGHIKSRNDKQTFLVAGSADNVCTHGPQVGARLSVMKGLRRVEPPREFIDIAGEGPDTRGLAVEFTFEEQLACDHFDATSATVVVVATSSSQLGDGAGSICNFISEAGAELVVMLDIGRAAGVTGPAPHIDKCLEEVSTWVAGRGGSMVVDVMYGNERLAVARVKHAGRQFRFALHGQKPFWLTDKLGDVRCLKLCGAGCWTHSGAGE